MSLLLTLTFKLVRARDQTRLSCELGANPFSSSRDISYRNKKTQTDGAKNRTFHTSLRAVINKIARLQRLLIFVTSRRTSNSLEPCQLLPTKSITAAPSTLLFQLPVVPNQPQIRVIEAKPNPNETLTLILTLIQTITLLTLLT